MLEGEDDSRDGGSILDNSNNGGYIEEYNDNNSLISHHVEKEDITDTPPPILTDSPIFEAKVDEKPAITPMPWKKLMGPFVLLTCEAIGNTSLFSYIGFMIIHFGVTTDEEKVGYYAGFVASSFSAAQFLSSFFWGKMSDIYGRKPILLIGCIGSIISVLAVGLSPNLPLLIISRTVNGMLNGNIGVIKTYIGEVTDKTNQVEAFGWIGLTWGFGSIVGPIVGGILSQPAHNIPFIFKNNYFFGELFPFFLPNLVIGLLTAVGLAFTHFTMKETLRHSPQEISLEVLEDEEEKIGGSDDGIALKKKKKKSKDASENENLVINSDSAVDIDVSEEQQINEYNMNSPTLSTDSTISSPRNSNDGDLSDVDEAATNKQQNNSILDATEAMKKNNKDLHGMVLENIKLDDDAIADATAGKPKGLSKYIPEVFRDKQIVEATMMYAIVGLVYTMYDEAFPIWSLAPITHGGLSFKSKDIGIVGAIGGLSVILMQIFVVKPVNMRLGIIKTFRLGCFLSVVGFLLMPTLNSMAPVKGESSEKHVVIFWIVLSIYTFFRNICTQLVFTPVMTLVNNSATSRKKGQANGLGQSLVALCRTIAPTMASVIVAWSVSSGNPFPINYWFIFILMGIFIIGPGIYSYFLPISLNAPKKEENEEDVDDSTPIFHME